VGLTGQSRPARGSSQEGTRKGPQPPQHPPRHRALGRGRAARRASGGRERGACRDWRLEAPQGPGVLDLGSGSWEAPDPDRPAVASIESIEPPWPISHQQPTGVVLALAMAAMGHMDWVNVAKWQVAPLSGHTKARAYQAPRPRGVAPKSDSPKWLFGPEGVLRFGARGLPGPARQPGAFSEPGGRGAPGYEIKAGPWFCVPGAPVT
jgi:hypothetical protein